MKKKTKVIILLIVVLISSLIVFCVCFFFRNNNHKMTQQESYKTLTKILDSKLSSKNKTVDVSVGSLNRNNTDVKVYIITPNYKKNVYETVSDEGIWLTKKHNNISDKRVPAEKAELIFDYFVNNGYITKDCNFNDFKIKKISKKNEKSLYIGILNINFNFYFSSNSLQEEKLLVNSLASSIMKSTSLDGLLIKVDGETYSSLYGNDFSKIISPINNY